MKKPGPDANGRHFDLKKRVQISLISLIGRLIIRTIGRTLRFRVSDWKNFQDLHDSGQPVILSFWHNQIPAATYFWRNRGIVVITSRNFDGEYIARIIERFGYGASRGSSSRGAAGALLGLKRRLSEGKDVAFTIDGPRGPLYQVKPGPVWLSRKTGSPIVCFHLEPDRYWELKSWDRMRIPRPFSRVLLKIGRPLPVPPGADDDVWVERYQSEMDRIRTFGEEYDWDHNRDPSPQSGDSK